MQAGPSQLTHERFPLAQLLPFPREAGDEPVPSASPLPHTQTRSRPASIQLRSGPPGGTPKVCLATAFSSHTRPGSPAAIVRMRGRPVRLTAKASFHRVLPSSNDRNTVVATAVHSFEQVTA